jgi:malonyl-CoA decarboxylase
MKPMQVSFFRELLETIFERRRALGPAGRGGPHGDMAKLARQLLSRRGELSGVAIAQQIVETYRHSTAPEKAAFFHLLATEFGPDVEEARGAASAFLESGDAAELARLGKLAEAPRREFFRRLNLAPGGTAAMVSMRAELLPLAADDPGLRPVDEDLAHLLNTWFNRGFLVLRRIDWSTPANILEKIIQYEAVHEIHDWDDLKRRLDPVDRRCFAFFHPALADEPLIFVEVALTDGGAPSVQALLSEERSPYAGRPTTAIFYSISNCQAGLTGISFGNFLIKQVVTDLASEQPQLKRFVTLSPLPGFMAWLQRLIEAQNGAIPPQTHELLMRLDDPAWIDDAETREALGDALMPLAARYLLQEKRQNGQPIDPVARFHLGNGARIEKLNWLGDTSPRGLGQSAGIMVNYLYEPKDIEQNHEAYAERGSIAAAPAVKKLLKQAGSVAAA